MALFDDLAKELILATTPRREPGRAARQLSETLSGVGRTVTTPIIQQAAVDIATGEYTLDATRLNLARGFIPTLPEEQQNRATTLLQTFEQNLKEINNPAMNANQIRELQRGNAEIRKELNTIIPKKSELMRLQQLATRRRADILNWQKEKFKLASNKEQQIYTSQRAIINKIEGTLRDTKKFKDFNPDNLTNVKQSLNNFGYSFDVGKAFMGSKLVNVATRDISSLYDGKLLAEAVYKKLERLGYYDRGKDAFTNPTEALKAIHNWGHGRGQYEIRNIMRDIIVTEGLKEAGAIDKKTGKLKLEVFHGDTLEEKQGTYESIYNDTTLLINNLFPKGLPSEYFENIFDLANASIGGGKRYSKPKALLGEVYQFIAKHGIGYPSPVRERAREEAKKHSNITYETSPTIY